MGQTARQAGALLSSGDVAAAFGVDRKTVHRWATSGRLPSAKTPGGHHRFRQSDVDALLSALTAAPAVEAR